MKFYSSSLKAVEFIKANNDNIDDEDRKIILRYILNSADLSFNFIKLKLFKNQQEKQLAIDRIARVPIIASKIYLDYKFELNEYELKQIWNSILEDPYSSYEIISNDLFLLKEERFELINTIILDSDIVLKFFNKCQFDDEESLYILKLLNDNDYLVYYFLKNMIADNLKHDRLQNSIKYSIDILFSYPNRIYDIIYVYPNYFNNDFICKIYDTYWKIYDKKYSSNFSSYYGFCCTFNKFLNKKCQKKLVKKLMKKSYKKHIHKALIEIKFDSEYVDLLNSYLIMEELR